MNSPYLETPERQNAAVTDLLREYADKLSKLNESWFKIANPPEYTSPAWRNKLALLLDLGERLKKPVLRIVGHASQLLEHADADASLDDELTLRLSEIEVQLHHAIRNTEWWNTELKRNAQETSIATLRMSSGLSGSATRTR